MAANTSTPQTLREERDERLRITLHESEVIRRNSGMVGWPTVLLCAGLVTAYSAVIASWFAGAAPLWVCTLVNAALSYAFYTVHHDANHKAISGRNDRWKWLDPLCGNVASLPIQIEFKGFSGSHLRHHANTNDPAKDPDVLVAGPLWMLPIKWLFGVVFGIVGALPGGERLMGGAIARLAPGRAPAQSDRMKADARRMRRFSQLCLIALVGSIPLGLFVPVFFLWWLPSRLGVFALMVLFQWLPHMPYESSERFHNTRITTFRGSTWLLLQQDRHLIHHLYPSVPWYRYRAVFRELRPLLEAEGARIEGRDSNPRRPITLTVATRG